MAGALQPQADVGHEVAPAVRLFVISLLDVQIGQVPEVVKQVQRIGPGPLAFEGQPPEQVGFGFVVVFQLGRKLGHVVGVHERALGLAKLVFGGGEPTRQGECLGVFALFFERSAAIQSGREPPVEVVRGTGRHAQAGVGLGLAVVAPQGMKIAPNFVSVAKYLPIVGLTGVPLSNGQQLKRIAHPLVLGHHGQQLVAQGQVPEVVDAAGQVARSGEVFQGQGFVAQQVHAGVTELAQRPDFPRRVAGALGKPERLAQKVQPGIGVFFAESFAKLPQQAAAGRVGARLVELMPQGVRLGLRPEQTGAT